jgi:hypothetical protein
VKCGTWPPYFEETLGNRSRDTSVYEIDTQVAAMNKPAHGPRWYAPWRQGEARVADDPADVGTAFGLELTLAAQTPPGTSPEPSARRPGWMQRLTTRRRASISAG